MLPLSLGAFLYYHITEGGYDVMTIDTVLLTFCADRF